MRKLLIFILILAVLCGAGYYWWQQNAQRLITERVHAMAGQFFSNPEALTIGPDNLTVKMKGLKAAQVPQLVISGKDVQMRNGPLLASAKFDLRNIDISGPPFRMTNIERGWFVASVNDTEVTNYLRQRKGSIAGVAVIPLNTVTVIFKDEVQHNTTLRAEATLPTSSIAIPLTARGVLTPAGQTGRMQQVEFQVKKFDGVPAIATSLVGRSLSLINPVFDLSKWPLETNIEKVVIEDGRATIRGTINGVKDQFLLLNK